MNGGNWMDETIPSQRTAPDGGVAGDDVQPQRTPAPIVAWFLGIAVILVALATCGLWALYLFHGRLAGDGPTPAPIIWTPTPAPTPTASPPPSPTEVSDGRPTASPEIAVGRHVQVAGTEGAGLNLRSGPGTNYPREDVALEGEVFIVTDGPTVSGGSAWWMIQDLENETRKWWAIANFLEPIEQP